MSALITVCGSAGTHPGPARACSSYLVTIDGFDLLLDCGNGSLANLQQRRDVADIDTLLLSHLHPDHFADLYGLYYARRFHLAGLKPLPVYAPVGAHQHIAQLIGSDETFGQVCQFDELNPGDALGIGRARVLIFEAAHPGRSLATRIEADGAVIAYTGDSGPSDALVDCARGADVLICDATWLERQRPLAAGMHMTGLEAGRLAAEAGVRRLLVTHVAPTNDADEVAEEAAKAYGGEIVVAQDLLELTL